MESGDSGATPTSDMQPRVTQRREPTWEAGDRERRLRALRDLAHRQLGGATSSTSAPVTAPSLPSAAQADTSDAPRSPLLAPHHARHRRPPLWRAGALVLLAVVVIVADIVIARFPSRPTVMKRPTGPALRINPANDLLACSVDTEWSPNQAYIAMLGYHGDCPGVDASQSVTGQLDIYDAASGQLLTSSPLDQKILFQASKAIGQGLTAGSILSPGSVVSPYIDYTGLLWSPDSTFLAVTFAILNQSYMFPTPDDYLATVPKPTPAIAGVWISGHLSPSPSFSAGRALVTPFTLGVDPLRRPAIEWDLLHNRLVSADVSLPPALGYVWSSDGTLIERDPVAPGQAPPTVTSQQIGTPDGGAYFSIWQSSSIEQGLIYTQTSSAGQPQQVQSKPVPNLYLWYSDFPIWSPDGRFLITPATYGGRLIIPGQPEVPLSVLIATGQDQAALLPFRDAAQQHLFPQQSGASLAWRPDGGVLAALTGTVERGLHINLYNCASGTLLRSIAVPPHVGGESVLSLSFLGPNPDGIYLRWSPDGQRILLYNPYGDGNIDVWSVAGV